MIKCQQTLNFKKMKYCTLYLHINMYNISRGLRVVHARFTPADKNQHVLAGIYTQNIHFKMFLQTMCMFNGFKEEICSSINA